MRGFDIGEADDYQKVRDRKSMQIGKRVSLMAALTCWLANGVAAAPPETLNGKDDGYRGIWYQNQPSHDEFAYKYSGGLGTYCAKHNPFAVYCPEVDKTFFCYGGATTEDSQQLIHMASYFDHKTGEVPQPTILLDKQTSDAHDNPIITVDRAGHVWIFSTAHGRGRPSFVHRSDKPYSVERFTRVEATYLDGEKARPLDNFSYMQTWQNGAGSFYSFFTHYGDPAARTIMFMKSDDGANWSQWQRLAAIGEGHYQVSAVRGTRGASAFNYHPDGKGLNHRTNLYFVETRDGGATWQTASGESLQLPLTDAANPALVYDFQSEGRLVYMKDLVFDSHDRPAILVITSQGYNSGPESGPREWRLVRWDGQRWTQSVIAVSDSNYDMGSLYVEGDAWKLIAPTATGPQAYNPGGEMCLWKSEDDGVTWREARQLTVDSPYNHTYARRPVNAHPDFYAFWADGNARRPSESRLYFCNRDGDVFQLPPVMTGPFARPKQLVDGRQPKSNATASRQPVQTNVGTGF